MKDKFSKFSLPLLWFFATIVIIFMMTLTVNAQDNSLPFIASNENIPGFEDFINQIVYNNGSNQVFKNAYENGDFFGYDYYEYGIHCFAFYVPQEEFVYTFNLSSDYSEFDITSDYADMTFSNYIYIKGYIEEYRGSYYFYGSVSRDNVSTPLTVRFFFGSNKGDGSLLVPNIASQNYNYQLNIYQPVFGLSVVNPPVDIGTAILPPSPIIPEYPTGTTPPANVPPTYTPQSYTPSPQPTPDFSTAEKTLESIYYYIQWGIADINGQFNLLKDNLAGFFEYIGATIQYYGNAILETLNNFIQNFYDNMANLIQPIFDKVNYIAQPLDMVAINTAFSSTNFYGVKTQFTNVFTAFENAFDIAEPNTFTLTINIQNIDTFYNFGCRSPVIIHLDEHFNPIKAALRTFLWILISFGTVFVVEKGLSNWLRGERNT